MRRLISVILAAALLLAAVPVVMGVVRGLPWSAGETASSALTCSVKVSCDAGEVAVFRMSGQANAHAGTAAGSAYANTVCCSGPAGLSTAATGCYGTVLTLSAADNAHAASDGSYATKATLSAPNTAIDCVYGATCDSDYSCLATISGTTNAHIADCDGTGDYPTKVCCRARPDVNTDAAIDNGPGVPGDDATIPNATADSEGDACESDGDIDNDTLPDSEDTNPLGATGICAAFAGSSDGHPSPAGGDVTNDDNHDGDPALPMGTDAADNGPSWDTDNDGVRDGVECTLGHNPRSRTDRPSTADCGGTGDTDSDGLQDVWEKCGWGTNKTVVDSDGDTRGDCKEAADVDGNGIVGFVGDTIYYAKAALLPRAAFGKTMDFDIDKNGTVDFIGDVIQEAKFALIPGMCQ